MHIMLVQMLVKSRRNNQKIHLRLHRRGNLESTARQSMTAFCNSRTGLVSPSSCKCYHKSSVLTSSRAYRLIFVPSLFGSVQAHTFWRHTRHPTTRRTCDLFVLVGPKRVIFGTDSLQQLYQSCHKCVVVN